MEEIDSVALETRPQRYTLLDSKSIPAEEASYHAIPTVHELIDKFDMLILFLEQKDKQNWKAALRAEAADRMAAGAVRGKTSMQLRELSAQETEMEMETDVSILGKIGEFGQPIIRKKADQMLSQFVENIKKQLAGN